MKLLLTISRGLVGLLFIFSGLVKANDPLGLSYKMQEFFEAWGWNFFDNYTLIFSIGMITLEVVIGVALLVGWRKKFTLWVLLALIVFFTFLTSYALFSGKIRSCGCFGDCIPLTPVQTFGKDIALLLLVFFLFSQMKRIKSNVSRAANVPVLIALLGTFGLQWYVLRHLPLVDCLPFKAGNDLVQQMQIPANATFDKFEYKFIYSKNGEEKEFDVKNLPDSSWTFVDRKQVLVEKGRNNEPPIKDFILKDANGNDATSGILTAPAVYYFYFYRSADKLDNDAVAALKKLRSFANKNNAPFYIVTANAASFSGIRDLPASMIYTCDVTAIKTAARTDPCLYKMKGPLVLHKWGAADFDQVQ